MHCSALLHMCEQLSMVSLNIKLVNEDIPYLTPFIFFFEERIYLGNLSCYKIFFHEQTYPINGQDSRSIMVLSIVNFVDAGIT